MKRLDLYKLTKEDLIKLCNSKTENEICDELCICTRTLHSMLKKFNLNKKFLVKDTRFSQREKIHKQLACELSDKSYDINSLRELSKQVGLSMGFCSRLLKEQGYKLMYMSTLEHNGKPITGIAKDFADSFNELHNICRVAKKHNVSRQYVSFVFKQNGYKIIKKHIYKKEGANE